MEATYRSIDRQRIRKLWYIYIIELLSYKKENIWVSSNEVDKTGAYYTERSKSEKETQILYIITYIQNLERQKWWSFMQDSKRDRYKEQTFGLGEGEGGMIWENNIETCILPYVKQMTSASSIHEAGTQSRCSGTTQRYGVGRKVQDRGNTCAPWQRPSQYCKVSILQLNK